MKTNLIKPVWLCCLMSVVVSNGGLGFRAVADEQVNKVEPVKPGAATAVAKPTDPTAKPEEKKREYKADTNPGTIFTNSIDMQLVRLAGGYWAGKYEVTQAEYQKVMNANPSAFAGDTRPVDSVSYNEAVEFCKQLNEIERKEESLPKGYVYALPTEGQWDGLAAGAGLDSAVCSFGQRRSATENVGSLAANSSGLYDVRGNVMEWCAGDPSKAYRVLRGGSWATNIEINLRPEFRFYATPDEKQNTFGFRVVLVSE